MLPTRRSLSPLLIAFATFAALPGDAAAQVPVVEQLTRIGCADCEGPTQFSAIFDAAVTDSGVIVAVDRSAPMIRAFDRTGKLLWTTGRSGQGPGEFLFPMRAAIGPDQSVHVVDMRTRRLTRLSKEGTVTGSHMLPGFPGASAVRGRTGEITLLVDDFRGPLSAQRWSAASPKPEPHATLPRPSSGRPGSVQPSIAVSPSGALAFVLDPYTYRIGRVDAAGRAMADVVRDLPPLRRTDAEFRELSDRLASRPGRRAAERGTGAVSPGDGPPRTDLAIKPHVLLDGLRYDDLGRLWVLTMRGVGQQSIFDVFATAGTLLGSVTLPVRVSTYSLAGPYLVTGGEDADDIPRLTLWRVRG